jgi:hypothetical protein
MLYIKLNLRFLLFALSGIHQSCTRNKNVIFVLYCSHQKNFVDNRPLTIKTKIFKNLTIIFLFSG